MELYHLLKLDYAYELSLNSFASYFFILFINYEIGACLMVAIWHHPLLKAC